MTITTPSSSSSADISQPSIIPVGVMKLKLILAGAIPSTIAVLILVTVVIIIYLVLRYKGKRAEESLEENVNNNKVKVIEILSKSNIDPKDYDKVVNLVHDLFQKTCDHCTSDHTDCGVVNVRESDLGGGVDEPDGSLEGSEASDDRAHLVKKNKKKEMSSQLLRMTVNMVQTGLVNQGIGHDLRKKLTEIVSGEATPTGTITKRDIAGRGNRDTRLNGYTSSV